MASSGYDAVVDVDDEVRLHDVSLATPSFKHHQFLVASLL